MLALGYRGRQNPEAPDIQSRLLSMAFPQDQSQAPELFAGNGRSSRTDRTSRRSSGDVKEKKEKKLVVDYFFFVWELPALPGR